MRCGYEKIDFFKNLLRSNSIAVCLLNVLCELSRGSDEKISAEKEKKLLQFASALIQCCGCRHGNPAEKNLNKVVDGRRNLNRLIANLTKV